MEQSAEGEGGDSSKKYTIKVGIVGDRRVGKTSLMESYVGYNDWYRYTWNGIFSSLDPLDHFEKEVNIASRGKTIGKVTLVLKTSSRYGHFSPDMMDMMVQSVCPEAHVVLFMFDLERPTTLNSIKDWYIRTRKCNKTFHPFLVGGKYDLFTQLPSQQQMEITQRARRYARAMKGALIYTSSLERINVNLLFYRWIITTVLDLATSNLRQMHNGPIRELPPPWNPPSLLSLCVEYVKNHRNDFDENQLNTLPTDLREQLGR